VLVSEVMLQQTQVRRVVPAYLRFLDGFPTPAVLAGAPLADVLRAWSGLGYNRRAAALWKAAGAIVAQHGAAVPSDPAVLARLPGIGPYTAAAVASVAYGVAVPAVDTNVRRVVARARLGREPSEVPAAQVVEAAASWLDRDAPGAWNQALMDLGRELCRPEPACAGCPLRATCRFRAAGRVAIHPPRRGEPFQGSMRQVRGRIVEELRAVPEASVGGLARRCREPVDRVAAAVSALASDGLVRAGPAALAGRAGGRVRLGA